MMENVCANVQVHCQFVQHQSDTMTSHALVDVQMENLNLVQEKQNGWKAHALVDAEASMRHALTQLKFSTKTFVNANVQTSLKCQNAKEVSALISTHVDVNARMLTKKVNVFHQRNGSIMTVVAVAKIYQKAFQKINNLIMILALSFASHQCQLKFHQI